jgi:hypothetical protein
MKKLIFAVLLLFPAIISAQGFEGVIKFSMEYKGDNADQMAMAAPKANVITIKGNKTKVVMEGGMMAAMIGDVINVGDEKMTYFVQASSKTVYKVKSEELSGDKDKEEPKVTKESSTATILGYKCQKYKVETSNGTNYVWATKDIDVGNADYRGKVSYKGVEGVIMKQEMNINQDGMKMTIIMTMVQFEKKTVSDSEFVIPSDYTVKEEMPAIMKMQMGK